jgi:hypothetical protein
MNAEGQPEYRYLQEISQMVRFDLVIVRSGNRSNVEVFKMFVFGDVVDPHPDVLKLVEDIVRNQVVEMVSSSAALFFMYIADFHFVCSCSNQEPWLLEGLLDFSHRKT